MKSGLCKNFPNALDYRRVLQRLDSVETTISQTVSRRQECRAVREKRNNSVLNNFSACLDNLSPGPILKGTHKRIGMRYFKNNFQCGWCELVIFQRAYLAKFAFENTAQLYYDT